MDNLALLEAVSRNIRRSYRGTAGVNLRRLHMMEFALPVLDASTPVSDAFGPMLESGTSGVISWDTDDVRLIRFDSLNEALSLGDQTLYNVRRWDAAFTTDADFVDLSGIADRLEAMGLSYGVFGKRGGFARVVSLHEPLATVYLAAPPGAKCKNPVKAHYYPPYKRDPLKFNRCVVCGYPLP